MARRNGWLDAVDTFNKTYDTVTNVGRDYMLAKAGNEKVQEFAPVDDVNLAAAPAVTANEDGTTAAPVLQVMPAETKKYQYLGQTYDKPIDERTQRGLLDRRRADIIGTFDPAAGMKLRREADQADRDEWRFGQEQQDAPLKREALQLGVNSARISNRKLEKDEAWETGFGKALAGYTGSAEQLSTAVPYINSKSKSITLGSRDPKTGLMQVSVVAADGRSSFMNLTHQDQAQVFAASSMMKSHPRQALEILGRVNKDLADAVSRDNSLTSTVANNNNDVAAKGHKMTTDRIQAGAMASSARSLVELRGAQLDELRATNRRREEMGKLQGSLDALDPASPNFEKDRRKIISQMNALNVKAGGQISLGGGGGNGREEKPVKVEEPGIQYKLGDKLVQTDGAGGYLDYKAPLPRDRAGVLLKLGLPTDVAATLGANNWSRDGLGVIYAGKEYALTPEDMIELNKAVAAERRTTEDRSITAKAQAGLRKSERDYNVSYPGENRWENGRMINSVYGDMSARPRLGLPAEFDIYNPR